ncbi:hypothetical protein Cs7R123_37350 [Catellatospora sp. TT07R-123]|uniref:hypothetical protein n=1 Tax=Catellatospora sp. TT07R-123 TaxID=2733863 RepID=UPI001B1AAACB|nr:hypothetical protein [Catellatospora sp. TT07R-123]GHJ46393.1 hypothetical protein Cs7R123_37350 [Catellatospora sp. TT07R-123]
MTVDDLRTRLTEEYGEERFTMTVTEIEQRAGTGARRRMAGWAVAGVAVLVAIAFLVWPTGGAGIVEPLASPSASPTARGSSAWRAGFAQACDQKWLEEDRSRLDPSLRGALPTLRFDVADGELGLRVYATGDTSLMVECERNSHDTGVSWSTPVAPFRSLLNDVGTQLPRFGTGSPPDENGVRQGADYYIGRVPVGTREILAYGENGEQFQALIDGSLYLLWAPDGGLRHAAVRAFTADRMITEGEGGHVDGAYREQALTEACRRTAAADFAQVGFGGLPPVRFKWHTGDHAAFLYGDENLMVVCRRLPDGPVTVTAVAALRDPSSVWQAMQFIDSDHSRHGWLLGLAPEGAVSGRAELRSGKKVTLSLSGGWFGAWWDSAEGVVDERPVRIEITTATQVWTVEDGQVTHRAR